MVLTGMDQGQLRARHDRFPPGSTSLWTTRSGKTAWGGGTNLGPPTAARCFGSLAEGRLLGTWGAWGWWTSSRTATSAGSCHAVHWEHLFIFCLYIFVSCYFEIWMTYSCDGMGTKIVVYLSERRMYIVYDFKISNWTNWYVSMFCLVLANLFIVHM